MWHNFRTKLAFQTWDRPLEMKMYIERFLHLGEGGEEHRGILHFKYNEYESLVLPIVRYLEKQGGHLVLNTEVIDMDLTKVNDDTHVTGLTLEHEDLHEYVSLSKQDYVFFTCGSMVQNASYGDNTTVAPINKSHDKGYFSLWEKLAKVDEKFDNAIEKAMWMSYSLTIKDDPTLVEKSNN